MALASTTEGRVMTVNKRTRYEVLKRDNFTCRYCRSTEDHLTVDHVVPVALGGSDDPDNLVACCRECNAGKSSTSPTEATVEDVKNTDMKWAAAIKRAADVHAARQAVADDYVSAFVERWGIKPLPRDWDPAVRRFHEAGLPMQTMLQAIDITFGNMWVDNRFRYFCGVCWNRITELQETAKALLEVEEAAE